MKKFFATTAILASLALPVAKADAAVPPVVVAVAAPGAAVFGGAVAGGVILTYLIATGVPFPLCGFEGLQCYGEYPGDHRRPVHAAAASHGFTQPYHVMVNGHDTIRSDGF